MKNCAKILMISTVVLLLLGSSVSAKNNTGDTRLFQNFFYDTPIAKTIHVEPGLEYSDYEAMSITDIGAKGGYPVNEKLEIQGGLAYRSWKVDGGGSESGITDLAAYGRYNLSKKKDMDIAVGGMITLPIGSDKIGEGHLDFGAFGAIRKPLKSGMVVTATVGLIFYEYTETEFNATTFELEEKKSHDNYLNIGAGLIYPMNEKINIVGELGMQTEGDYMMLSAGMDYLMGSGRLRVALGIGLDDGAPDLAIMAGYGLTL